MPTHIILVEQPKDWRDSYPGALIVPAKDYVSKSEYLGLKDVRIINLCRSYRYLSLGYYCSLLAEARRHKIIPSVKTITELSSRAIYSLNVDDLDMPVQKSLGRGVNGTPPPPDSKFELNIYFGQCDYPQLQDLARQLFDLFPCPLLKVELRHQGKWSISSIRPTYINNITPEQEPSFCNALKSYVTRPWRTPRARQVARYDIAILNNPTEKMPPSSTRTLQQFIKAGKKLGVDVELIEKKDYPHLAEYDALFIRETTQIDHHTYRFAKKAESESMVVIDDSESILKCTNKVYLAELLATHKIPTPKTVILRKDNLRMLDELRPYPIVLKVPDGSFSRGVFKVEDPREMEEFSTRLFKDSDLLLAQEFVYTEFDWRVAVLNRKPLFACQYFMPKKHWQIFKHGPDGRMEEGRYKTHLVENTPPEVIDTAVKAASLIGDGLYGVDLKQTDKGVIVIEVNDNPNIDAGVEDACLGDRLYTIIMEEFVRRLDQRKGL